MIISCKTNKGKEVSFNINHLVLVENTDKEQIVHLSNGVCLYLKPNTIKLNSSIIPPMGQMGRA